MVGIQSIDFDKNPKKKSKFNLCDLKNRSRSTIFLSALRLVQSNNHPKFEQNPCNNHVEDFRSKCHADAATDTASETTQKHIGYSSTFHVGANYKPNTL